MSDLRPKFPVQAARQTSTGAAAPVAITEMLSVQNGYVRLKEAPQFDPASSARVVIPGYEEVLSSPSLPTQYYVNYLTGRVYFHASQNGATVRVEYNGLGSVVAVDEINWLWERALLVNSFVGLEDTPDALTPRGFVRANYTGTMLEMSDASVGRSQSVARLLALGVGEQATLPGSIFDVIHFYRPVAATPVAADADMLYTGSPAENVAFNGSFWQLVGPGKMSAALAPGGAFDVPDITRLTGLHVEAIVPVGAIVRVLLQLADGFYVATGYGLEYLGTTMPASIKAAGCAPADVNNLTAGQLAPFTGMPARVHVYLESNDAGETPQVSPVLTVEYDEGGGFELVEHSATFDAQAETWTVSTQAAGGSFLVLQGSGHDDAVCASEAVEFESVAPGEAVYLSAPVQSVINVLASQRFPDDVSSFPTGSAPWQQSTGAALDFARVAGQAVVQAIPAVKDVVTAMPGANKYSAFNALTFPPQQLVSGGPALSLGGGGGPFVTRGLFGPALKLAGAENVPMYASWLLIHSGESPGYANRTIGGWFKWVDGAPIIISASQAWSSTGSRNQLYVRLYQDRVICTLGFVTRTVMYTPGDWVFVGLTSIYSWHQDAAHDDKGCVFIVNKGMYSMIHAEWNVPTHQVTVPNCIGEGSPNLSAAGTFLVDHALGYSRNIGQADVNAIVDNALAARDAAVVNEFNWHRAAALFPVPTTGAYSAIGATNPSWDIQNDTGPRFFWEKGGVYYTWSADAGAIVTVSMAQPGAMLYSLGTKLSDLASIPKADVQALLNSSRMYVLAYGAAGRKELPGFPDTVLLSNENFTKAWKLARPGVDMAASYLDTRRAWRITNIGTATCSLRVGALGAAANNAVRPVRFGELVDGVDLFDAQPKTLVSVDGRFDKRTFVHPYLLGSI